MTVKTILACFLNQGSASVLSNAATALAARHDAHVTGLHALEAIIIYPGVGMYVPGPTFAALTAAQRTDGEAIGAIFEEAARLAGGAREWRMVHAGAVTAADRIIESARASDLVVMARPESGSERSDQRHAFSRVVREAGRPVLVVPPAGLPTDGVGQRVVIAHAPTREAARAAFDALSLLSEGAELHLVHAGDERDELRDDAMTDLAGALARHGAKVTLTHRPLRGRTVAKVLEDEVAEIGADLIVAGAFGHSRTYDFFVGATTGDLMRSSEVPVLFSG
jgi:nucleotide-binding universal stress UspA family protein